MSAWKPVDFGAGTLDLVMPCARMYASKRAGSFWSAPNSAVTAATTSSAAKPFRLAVRAS